ncbi:MAG: Lrp/AsnC family transcriptional regulator, partial [Candidatus Nanoarchaeia archaeon]
MPIKQALKSRILDEKDKKILMLLQNDGRMSLTNIAKKVNLSIDSVNNRMKAMREKRVFHVGAHVNPRACGFPLIADIKIKLDNITEEAKS